jgi:hypothetical protein
LSAIWVAGTENEFEDRTSQGVRISFRSSRGVDSPSCGVKQDSLFIHYAQS